MEKDNRKYFWLVILLLLIIIIILLFLGRFGKINEYLIPTGNVDVFDIDINCDCDTCDVVSDKDNNQSNSTKKKINKVYKQFDEEEDSNVTGTIFVDDENGDYIYQEHLNIFTNPAYEFTNKIAPGSSNTYYFVVHNSTDVNLVYKIKFYEESEYKVNLKYRLKRNDKYIIGNDTRWVSAKDLITEMNSITFGSSDNYSLDWKWFDSDKNDTIAGKKMDGLYKLNIRFYFEEEV